MRNDEELCHRKVLDVERNLGPHGGWQSSAVCLPLSPGPSLTE